MSTAKKKYIAFTQDNFVPIFYRADYLNAVCDGHWDVVLFEEKEKIAAAYIYMIKQKLMLKYIIQPELCPYTGPLYFNPSNDKKAYTYLLEHLPKHHLIIQDYFPNIPAIEEIDFTHTKKHTYILSSGVDVDILWQAQSSTHRRIIRKADKELTYEEEESANVFLEFVEETFGKRNKNVPNNPIVFKKLDEILLKHGQRKIVKCTNQKNEVVAMCYFIRDEKWTYNFANGVVDDYRHYGMNLILWNEIKETLSEGRNFDFEGSMIPGIDEFFKRFKGTKTFYQSRHKSSNKIVDFLVKLKSQK